VFLQHYRSIPWRRVARRVVSETWNDDVFGRAAQLAYFWLFSLFPFLLIVIVILGYLAQGTHMRDSLLQFVSRAVPQASFGMLRQTLDEVTSHAGAGKLAFGIVTTVWAASSGMSAVIGALNKAYEVREGRAWWKSRLIAVALTVALAIFIVVALATLFYGSRLSMRAGLYAGFSSQFAGAWAVLQWPLAAALVMFAFLLVYRFAPNLKDQKIWWLLPGAAVAVLLWIGLSLGLRLYLEYFDSYTTVYGGLGAVLILLLWIYLSSAALLIGGELNSEIENAAAGQGASDAKQAGEKAPGEGAMRPSFVPNQPGHSSPHAV
jgi:membrane protein